MDRWLTPNSKAASTREAFWLAVLAGVMIAI